ncbi:hypothetical protein LY76DRAFT_596092 [Colletotrichum caudatum]|nr:hypothetical protein LY76DRAFT_596092 [Colletotrichum caudatum]
MDHPITQVATAIYIVPSNRASGRPGFLVEQASEQAPWPTSQSTVVAVSGHKEEMALRLETGLRSEFVYMRESQSLQAPASNRLSREKFAADGLSPILSSCARSCSPHPEQGQHTEEFSSMYAPGPPHMFVPQIMFSTVSPTLPHRRAASGKSAVSVQLRRGAGGQPLQQSSSLRGSSALGGLGSPVPFLLRHSTPNISQSCLGASALT